MQPTSSPSNTTSTSTSTSPTSLAHQINSTTRRTHTVLNKRILHLLPLALPPHTDDASLYAQGMSYILPIYRAFESSFSQMLTTAPTQRTPLIEALANLHIPDLERTTRLSEDLRHLCPSLSLPSSSPRSSPVSSTSPRQATDAQEEDERKSKSKQTPTLNSNHHTHPPLNRLPLLANFTTHVPAAISTRPHLLLSYIHIFYLALFSGGRYIRAALRRSAGDIFPEPAEEGLRFWCFDEGGEGDRDRDGEDLKEEFKARWAVVAGLLDETQRMEVLAEAEKVMELMVGIVGEVEGAINGSGGGGVVMVATDGGERGNMRIGMGPQEKKGRLDNEKHGNDHDDTHDEHENNKGVQEEWWLLLKHILPIGLADLILAGVSAIY